MSVSCLYLSYTHSENSLDDDLHRHEFKRSSKAFSNYMKNIKARLMYILSAFCLAINVFKMTMIY